MFGNNCLARLASLVVSVLTLACVSAVRAQFAFDPALSTPLAQRPAGVASGDWDDDGDVDLAVSADTPDRVVIYRNNGDGTFATPVDVLTGAGTGPGFVVAGDWDNDTDADLAVALQNTDSVLVLLNNGSGAFAPGATSAVGVNPRAIFAGPLDANSNVDLAVVNRDSNDVSILLNNGNATFGPAVNVAVGADPRGIAGGTWDGDGDVDLAVTNHDDRSISILTNDGAGGFVVSSTLSVGPDLRPDGIAAGDLDGDTDNDLAVATSGNALNFASVFTNPGGGAFGGPFHYPVSGVNPGRVLIADLDCDYDLDVVTVNQDSGDVSLLPNAGNATFGVATVLAVGTTPQDAAAADLDSDHVPDLSVANRDSNDVSLLLNGSVVPKDGDADGDGDSDLRDFADFQVCFSGPITDPGFVSPGTVCLGDFDFDCDADVDGDDHVAFGALLNGPQ